MSPTPLVGGAPRTTGGDRLNLLLVDDEAMIREVFSEMLSDLGHRVTALADPASAHAEVAPGRFDIAFLDHFLGPQLGLDLMQQLATTDPELYFVMITANGNTDLAVQAMQRGASDFLVKPFFEEDIVRSIDYVRRKRELDLHRKGLLLEMESRVKAKTEEIIEVNFAVLTSLARAVEKKDLGTYGHSMRVCGYAELIADRLGLPGADRNDLRAAAMLHDIGKIGISDAILGKPGPLNAEETATLRKHPENGVEILRPLTHYGSILPVILHHHEHVDGSGYPGGLVGTDIPLLARIISVADTYDAIVSNRPYRKAAASRQAVAELLRMSGKQFDTDVVKAFLAVLDEQQGPPLRTGDRPRTQRDDSRDTEFAQ